MTYCTTNFIRTVVDVPDDVGDSDLSDLRDKVAVPELNQDIYMYIEDERVQHISSDKDNSIDDSNKTFYLAELHENHRHLGDKNDDGSVDASDIDAYVIRDGDTRISNLNVTVKDEAEGELEIEDSNGDALENGDELYISYAVSPVDITSPHPLVKVACAMLTAAYSFTKVEAKKHKSFKVGDVSVRKLSGGDDDTMEQYHQVVGKITQREQVQTKENVNQLADMDVFPEDFKG